MWGKEREAVGGNRDKGMEEGKGTRERTRREVCVGLGENAWRLCGIRGG